MNRNEQDEEEDEKDADWGGKKKTENKVEQEVL